VSDIPSSRDSSEIAVFSSRSSRRVKGVSTREILTPTVRVGDIPLRGGYGAAGIEEQRE